MQRCKDDGERQFILYPMILVRTQYDPPCSLTVFFILGACVKRLLFPQSLLTPLGPREPIKSERDNELHNNKSPSNRL